MDPSPRQATKGPLWKRKKVVVYLIFVLLLIALMAYVHGIKRVDAQKLDRLISQRLPPGTDEAQVIEFLDSNHIEHSEYISNYKRIDAYILKSTIGLVNGRIYIVFIFNEDGKLVKYDLRELFPGL